MRLIISIVFNVLLMLLPLGLNPLADEIPTGINKFVPPGHKTLIVIGQDKESIENYVTHIDLIPAGLMVYTSIQKLDGIESARDVGGHNIQDAQFLLTQYPQSIMQVGLQLVDALDSVLAGTYDQNIVKLAQWFKQNHRPFYLRIGYEFDHPDNHYDPQTYQKTFRYIVNKFRELEVDNVAFVWHSYAGLTQHPPMDWYPGDQYVDWVGISFFSPYNDDNFKLIAAIAKEHNKPLMIAESAPIKMPTTGGDETWKKWFGFVFKFIEDNDVKMFCYINAHWDKQRLFTLYYWGDSRIEASEAIEKKWRDEIQKENFLNASEGLFRMLGYSP